MICSDPLPSAGCAGDLELADTGCVEGLGETQASDGAAVDAEGAGCVAAVDDKQADAEPEGPTRRKAERALREIGYTRREAETIMRAGLDALTEGAPDVGDDQLNPLLQLLDKRIAAAAKGRPS